MALVFGRWGLDYTLGGINALFTTDIPDTIEFEHHEPDPKGTHPMVTIVPIETPTLGDRSYLVHEAGTVI